MRSVACAAAARASLEDKDLVPLRKKINADVRDETQAFLAKHGYKFVRGSQANMLMIDVHRPGDEFQASMLDYGVAIGRTSAVACRGLAITFGAT